MSTLGPDVFGIKVSQERHPVIRPRRPVAGDPCHQATEACHKPRMLTLVLFFRLTEIRKRRKSGSFSRSQPHWVNHLILLRLPGA